MMRQGCVVEMGGDGKEREDGGRHTRDCRALSIGVGMVVIRRERDE
jgi:hypothetical protein